MSKHERKPENSIPEQSRKVAGEVHELGRIAAARLRKKGNEVLETGIERAKKARITVDDYIVEHPVKVVLIALGAGGLLGFLLRRPG